MNTLPSVSRRTPRVSRRRASFISCQLISLLLTYALLLQLVPFRANAATVIASKTGRRTLSTTGDQKKRGRDFNGEIAASANGVFFPEPQTGSGSNTIADAVVSRHAPTLTKGSVDGSIRVFSGESFAVNSQDQLTGDLYAVGTPNIFVQSGATYGGTVSDGASSSPSDYSITLQSGVSMPGKIHTRADALTLPADVPTSVPAPTGTRNVTVQSQSDVANLGSWQTLRDLNVTATHLTINVPPGDYGTFTVNGNSQLNFTAGTYNFANTFNLDGGAVIQATGIVTINVGQNLAVTSGALALGSYTSPGDVRVNVLGSVLNINGSSQVSGLVRGANATVSINNTAQVRGQVIANGFILNGGKVTGAVWPARTGGSMSIFGPRRFDRTTGPPNQYVEQFSLPAGVNSPFTLHIQNGAPDGVNRVSSATASLTLNGVNVLSQSDLNQNIAGLDRTVTLATYNTLEVRVASDPGSYLIINIGGVVLSDTTPPTVSITSPANNSTTDASQTTVNGTVSDTGANASGVAHVYVNGIEASHNSANGTWTISNVALSIGANQIRTR